MGYAAFIPKEVDGVNLAGYLTTGKGKKPGSQWYMRISDADASLGLRGVRTDRYTFVIDQQNENQRSVLLFDREMDPYQQKNIAGQNPLLEKELTLKLQEWLEKYRDPWIKNIR